MIAQFVVVVVVAYLIGSIPFGLIIGKIASGIDIRNYGKVEKGGENKKDP